MPPRIRGKDPNRVEHQQVTVPRSPNTPLITMAFWVSENSLLANGNENAKKDNPIEMRISELWTPMVYVEPTKGVPKTVLSVVPLKLIQQ